jgi:hypothetical protein
MSRSRATYTQSDIVRVFKAAAKAGVNVRVEIADGKMVVTARKPSEASLNGLNPNPWDEVLLEDHERY